MDTLAAPHVVPPSRRRLLKATAAASLLGCFPAARALEGRVRVLTSYAEELTQRYVRGFERLNPGVRVEILWRQSADALSYLQHGGTREVDVYWSPAPGNFMAMRKAEMLAPLTLARGALPGVREGLPISDPDGYFAAFELAGYGIAFNTARVQALGLPAPTAWADLAAPEFSGQVQLPIPGRVGFAPGLIEAILQGQGWAAGWQLLAALAANADFGAGDTTPGADDVVSGKKAARLTIDFFANAAIASGAPIRFAYPTRTAYNPAQIGILKAAPNPAGAQAFVDYALSPEGQTLLLHPDIRRLPVLPEIYAAHPELTAQPFAAGHLAYDPSITRDRQGLVAALFEAALVKPHAQWLPLWHTLRQAEAKSTASSETLREARALLTSPLVSDNEQSSASLRRLTAFAERAPVPAGRAANGSDTVADTRSPERQALEAQWEATIEQRIARASTLLKGLA